MSDKGYDDRPVQGLSDAELLEQALQVRHSAGYYAGVMEQGGKRATYQLLLTEAIARRDACFEELRRRLEAARVLAEAAKFFAESDGLRQGINFLWYTRPCSIEMYEQLQTALRSFQQEATDG